LIEVDELIMETLDDLPCRVFKYRAVTKDPTYIVFYIWNEHDIFYADDDPIGTASMITVSIYSDDEAKPLVKLVKTKLRGAGFSIVSSHSVYNEETDRIQNIIEISCEDINSPEANFDHE